MAKIKKAASDEIRGYRQGNPKMTSDGAGQYTKTSKRSNSRGPRKPSRGQGK